jgi:hypothetical protein
VSRISRLQAGRNGHRICRALPAHEHGNPNQGGTGPCRSGGKKVHGKCQRGGRGGGPGNTCRTVAGVTVPLAVFRASRLDPVGHWVRYLLDNELASEPDAPEMNRRANSQLLTGAPNPDGLGTKATQSIAALAGMLLVAAAGAILNWPWWLEYALITPPAIWLIINSRLVVYRQLNSNAASPDRRVPVVLVVPILFAAAIQPTRFRVSW